MWFPWSHLRSGRVIPVSLTDSLPPISLNDCRNMVYSIFGISPVIVCDVNVLAGSVVFSFPVSWYATVTMVMGLFPSNELVQVSKSCVVVAVTMMLLGASGGTIDIRYYVILTQNVF